MKVALLREELSLETRSPLVTFSSYEENLSGVVEIDNLLGGLPPGAITEIFGAASTGKTSLINAILATATRNEAFCAYIDLAGSFDPVSSAGFDIDLEKLIWVRCQGNLEHAFEAANLMVSAGGLGVIILDLSDLAVDTAKKIQHSYWYKFRYAIENKSTVFLVVSNTAITRSASSVRLECSRKEAIWTGSENFLLLKRVVYSLTARKPLSFNRTSEIHREAI